MKLTMRRVETSDLKDILEISRHVWEGHDYLPSIIEEWLTDPNSYTYGAEVDGRLVGLDNLRLVENGRTGWMEGLRVHPDYRGKGLANKLTDRMIKEGQRLKVQRLRYTTAVDNLASLKLAEKTGFKRLLEMGVFWHPNPNAIPPPGAYPPIRESNPETVYELVLANAQIMSRSILVYDWKALDSTLEAFKTVGESNQFYAALEKGNLNSFSLGHLRDTGSTWSFTIYAHETLGFQSQMSHHITLALENRQRNIMCTYNSKFEEAVRQLDWTSKDYWNTRLVLLEKPMPQS